MGMSRYVYVRYTLIFSICIVSLEALQFQSATASSSRRRLLLEGVFVGASAWSLSTEDALAVKGAAEYDLEYYMRDLMGGNAKEGNVLPSKAPPAPPPRTLKKPLLPLLLNDECDPTCIPTQVLLEQIKSNDGTFVTNKMKDYRDKASRSFAARAPWKEAHVSDQYFFDLTCYALWRTAAELIPNYVQRDVFARNVGRNLYKQARQTGLLQAKVGTTLTSTIAAAEEVMNMFQAFQYCKSYRFGEKSQSTVMLFDEYDDDDLALGTSVNCLISIFEPASLGASLQITGEQSRFTPEFVGVTLAAMWEEAGLKTSYETYFVDNEYRPNPKDFYPNEQLLQFAISRA